MENNKLTQELTILFDTMAIAEKKSIDLNVLSNMNIQDPTGKLDKKSYELFEQSLKSSLHNFDYFYDENIVHLQRIDVEVLH